MEQPNRMDVMVRAVGLADPTLAADLAANLDTLRRLAPVVIEAQLKIRDQGDRLQRAVNAAEAREVYDDLYGQCPQLADLDAAYRLADIITDAHPGWIK